MGSPLMKMRQITEVYEMSVFTDSGDYFGKVEEAILTPNKIFGWRVKADKNSVLTTMLGNAKGVVVPHGLVKAIGDVMIIQKPDSSPVGVESASE